MHILSSRILLRACLLLFVVQTSFVDARSKKDKKKVEEDAPPDPVKEDEVSEPAASGRDARQHPERPEEVEGQAENAAEDVVSENTGEGVERTKKSPYCGNSRNAGYGGGGYPHGGMGHEPGPHPYGLTDGPYQPRMEGYHPHGPSHPEGFGPHGHDMTDHHQQGHYGGPEGHGGDDDKEHVDYARKSQGDYYGGQGNKGGEQYHAAASAPSSVYRPSYQAGHDAYGGGGPDSHPSYGYGGRGPYYNSAPYQGNYYPPPSGAQHDYHYTSHPYAAQVPGYGAAQMRPGYGGGGAYPHPAAYGPAPSQYGPPPMYGPMYHSPSGYPPMSNAYNPYMSYNAPPSYQYSAPYSMSPYPQPYGYGPSVPSYPPFAYGPHLGQAIPVTLTCSLQQREAPYGYPQHPRGDPNVYREASGPAESPPLNTTKTPLIVQVMPSNQNQPPRLNSDKPAGKEQKDQPTVVAKKEEKEVVAAMGNSAKPEIMRPDTNVVMQHPSGGMQQQGPHGPPGREPIGPREMADYQRMPFSVIRQRQLESMTGPKTVFYQPHY